MKGLVAKVANAKNSIIFAAKKNSPEILVGIGMVGVVAGTILACRATLKAKEVTDEAKVKLKDIDALKDKEPEEGEQKYEENDIKKAKAIVIGQTAIKVARLYSLSAAVEIVSLGCITGAVRRYRKRNLGYASAYAILNEGFEKYRKGVIERYGEEADKDIRYNRTKEKVEEVVTDEETGKEKKVKKTVGVSDLSEYSDYAVYFDSRSPYYEGNHDYDMIFLNSQMNYATDLLRIKKSLTLNEVLDALGIKGSKKLRKAGMVVGWKYEEDNPVGDNKVLFYIEDTYRKREDGKVEPCIIIDFNVDGEIYSRMDDDEEEDE